MSSSLGGSVSWSTSAALAWMVVDVWVFGDGGFFFGVGLSRSGCVSETRDALDLSCLRLGDGGWSLALSTPVGG